MAANAPSGERNDEARSAGRAAYYNPFACWALARTRQRSMIQAVVTLVALVGCVLIVALLTLDEKLPLYFRVPIGICAVIPVMYLAYLSVQQARPWLRAWFRRGEDNAGAEEATPLSGQPRLRAAPPHSAARSNSFVYQNPGPSNPLPENPPPYRRTPSPPRYSALPGYPLGPQPNPRPVLYIPPPPPPFPIPPLPLGYPSQPTAPPYEANTSPSSLETAVRNCYRYDQAWAPLVRGSREPSPASSVRGDERSNSDSEQEHAV